MLWMGESKYAYKAGGQAMSGEKKTPISMDLTLGDLTNLCEGVDDPEAIDVRLRVNGKDLDARSIEVITRGNKTTFVIIPVIGFKKSEPPKAE